MRDVHPLGEHDAVRGGTVLIAVGDHVERAPVVAAQHAGEAAPVGDHRLQYPPTLGDADTPLIGDVGVPTGAVGVEADPVGRGGLPQLGPNAPIGEAPV